MRSATRLPPVEAPVATEPIAFIKARLSPVATYNCEEDGNPLLSDLSGNFLNGEINGARFNANSSHDGSDALSFDGTNAEVVIGDQPLLDFDDALTIAAWVRTNDANSNQCIVSKNNAYYLYLYGTSRGARLRVGINVDGNWQNVTTSAAHTVQSDLWTHVTATYDGNHVRVFLDGVEVGAKSITGRITSNRKDVKIGTLWNGYRWDGELDDITLFDRALDSSEINLLRSGDWLDPLVSPTDTDRRAENFTDSTDSDSNNGDE